MKYRSIRALIAATTLLMVAGCTKDSLDESSVVRFSTQSLMSRVTTTASASEWNAGDEVGISSDIGDNNVYYVADQSNSETSFSFADSNTSSEILFPRPVETKANYTAYYPYQADASTLGYYISDVSSQSDYSKIDFIVGAATVADRYEDDGKGDVVFVFDHKLSMIEFTVIANEIVPDLSELIAVTLGEITTVANFSLTTAEWISSSSTGTVSLNIEVDTEKTTATATAIINPVAFTNATLLFTLKDGTQYSALISLTPLLGKIHEYELSLNNSKVVFITDNAISEWSSDSEAPNIGSFDIITE